MDGILREFGRKDKNGASTQSHGLNVRGSFWNSKGFAKQRIKRKMVIASNYQTFPGARAGFGPGDDETFGALYRVLTEDDLG